MKAGESIGPSLRESRGVSDVFSAVCAATLAGSVAFLFGSPLYRRDGVSPERLAATAALNSAKSGSSAQSSPRLPSPALLLALLVPLPVFYTILYQQNTTMVTQAGLLDRHAFGTKYQVPPDLMASLEDWFLLFIIPCKSIVCLIVHCIVFLFKKKKLKGIFSF